MSVIPDKDFVSAVQKALKSSGKVELGEYVVEYYDPRTSAQETVSAFLSTNAGDVFANDSNNNNDNAFTHFLGEDFAKTPSLLLSKERKQSTSAEKSQKQLFSAPEVIGDTVRTAEKKSSSSDVWGSPLKCGIPSEDSFMDSELFDMSQMLGTSRKRAAKRRGISLHTARRFGSAFNLQFEAHLDSAGFLVFCDGKDLRSTALIGSRIVQIPDQDKLTRAFKTTMVTVKQKSSSDCNSYPKVEIFSGKSSCQAVYEVDVSAEEGEEPLGVVALEMTWKGAKQLLESPPSDARCTVRASVRPGNVRSSMYKFFLELHLLKRIFTALTVGEMKWTSDVSDKTAIPLIVSVQNLIDRIRDQGSMESAACQGVGEAGETVTFSTTLKKVKITERSDYDFTDQLWKVMTDCMSTASLIDSLRLVFSALGRGELQPFVNQQNQTTVAQIVREAFTGRFSTPSLSGVQPFLFLAEIGAEKLRRDYINIFVSQRLAGMSFLSPFIAAEGEMSDHLSQLEKLHTSLEMVALLERTLHLSPDALGSAARQMLSQPTHLSFDCHHKYSSSLKTAEVHTVLSSLRPVMWSLETHTPAGLGNIQESDLYCLCANQPFLHMSSSIRKSEGSMGEKGEGKTSMVDSDQENQYFVVHRTETVIIM